MRQQIANLVLVVSLSWAGLAFSATESEIIERQPPGDDDIENIVVTGQRPAVLRQLMGEFIFEISQPSMGRGYARWRDRLCVGVYNLPDSKMAQYIADKITITALELGLKTGAPGCEPGLHIIFSPEARELANRMVEESPRMFRPFGGAEGTTQGLAALEKFKSSEAPVRWWQITMVVDEFGSPAVPLLYWQGGGSTTVRGVASRLKSPINDEIWAGLILVDTGKLDNVTWPQLADYIAMVSLAQIDSNSRPSGYDSILNLFRADNPPRGMTDMDRTYLRALYDMDTMMLPHTQRGVFANKMVRVILKMDEED